MLPLAIVTGVIAALVMLVALAKWHPLSRHGLPPVLVVVTVLPSMRVAHRLPPPHPAATMVYGTVIAVPCLVPAGVLLLARIV